MDEAVVGRPSLVLRKVDMAVAALECESECWVLSSGGVAVVALHAPPVWRIGVRPGTPPQWISEWRARLLPRVSSKQKDSLRSGVHGPERSSPSRADR